MRRILFAVFVVVIVSGCSSLFDRVALTSGDAHDNFHLTRAYYDTLIKSPQPKTAELTLFFAKMPKGGDIHHHYSGALYAETYLDWVKAKGWWINREDFTLAEKWAPPATITVDELRKDSARYSAFLQLWSSKDHGSLFHFQNLFVYALPPNQQFFNTFGYFGKISSADYKQGLKILKRRALLENVQYIETMLGAVKYGKDDDAFDTLLYKCQDSHNEKEMVEALAARASVIENDSDFRDAVANYVTLVEESHKGIDDTLFTMRFQTYASRNSAPSVVFATLYAGFTAARDSNLIVAVNIVGPENEVVAMRDYWLHMQMFNFLRHRFHNVHVAVHAGELALGMVEPEELTHHIRDAVYIAGADRVGHGVDIPYEGESVELLEFMARNGKAVEINLTSNEFILGVKNEAHPITIYRRQGVPIVIATDDAGVSRNSLTHEYVLLATRYGFSYKEVKQFVYNSITYSFMDEWAKERNRKLLDDKFARFEAEIAKFVTGIKVSGSGVISGTGVTH